MTVHQVRQSARALGGILDIDDALRPTRDGTLNQRHSSARFLHAALRSLVMGLAAACYVGPSIPTELARAPARERDIKTASLGLAQFMTEGEVQKLLGSPSHTEISTFGSGTDEPWQGLVWTYGVGRASSHLDVVFSQTAIDVVSAKFLFAWVSTLPDERALRIWKAVASDIIQLVDQVDPDGMVALRQLKRLATSLWDEAGAPSKEIEVTQARLVERLRLEYDGAEPLPTRSHWFVNHWSWW